MSTQDIFQLADMMGLASEPDVSNEQMQGDFIAALTGFSITGDYAECFNEKVKQFWLRALPPVVFVENQRQLDFDLHLPIEFVTEDLIWQICDKDGTLLESGEFTPIEWQLNGIYHIHDMEIQSYQIAFEQLLAVGDYQLQILDQGNEEPLGETRLVVSPESLSVNADKSVSAAALSFADLFTGELAQVVLSEYRATINTNDNVLNSYQLREDGYQAWSSYLEQLMASSQAVVLTDPLSFAQQWLQIDESGVWQTHEFHELMSLAIYHCQKNSCACFYQADDLPEEVTNYFSERGISPY